MRSNAIGMSGARHLTPAPAAVSLSVPRLGVAASSEPRVYPTVAA